MEPQKESSRELLANEVIAKLRHFVKLYGIDSLFIAGGYCRALYMGKPWEIHDIDVASAFHEQAVQLGGLFASEVLHSVPKTYKRSGALAVEYSSEFGSITVEFQGHSTNSYMHNQEVREWMHNNGIEDVPLMNNIYGRDFTMNSFIYSLEDDTLYDPTGKGEEDIKKKLISPLLPADLLVRYNPLSILRAIRFALTYKFYIGSDMRQAMKNGKELLTKTLSEERILKEIVRILKIDGPKALEMLKNFNLDGLLLHPDIKRYLDIKAKK